MGFAIRRWCLLLAVLQEAHSPETTSHHQSRSIFLPRLALPVPAETPRASQTLEEEMQMYGQSLPDLQRSI